MKLTQSLGQPCEFCLPLQVPNLTVVEGADRLMVRQLDVAGAALLQEKVGRPGGEAPTPPARDSRPH